MGSSELTEKFYGYFVYLWFLFSSFGLAATTFIFQYILAVFIWGFFISINKNEFSFYDIYPYLLILVFFAFWEFYSHKLKKIIFRSKATKRVNSLIFVLGKFIAPSLIFLWFTMKDFGTPFGIAVIMVSWAYIIVLDRIYEKFLKNYK